MSKNKCDPGKTALVWWRELQPKTDKSGNVTSRGDPGSLARLRRAGSPVDALTEAQAICLAKRLGVTLNSQQRLLRIGALAAVLAHVKSHKETADKKRPVHMAQMLGPDRDESAAMSSLRFQRLMAAREPADLMREMRGAVKLLKGSANIENLAEAFYFWNDQTRLTWTYNYWGAGEADPATTDNQTNPDTSSKQSDTNTTEEAAA